MDCFKNKAVKVEVPPSEKTVTIAPRGLGIALKVPPEALQQTGAPPTFAFTTCTPESFVYPDGYKSLSPIYYIASNKPLEEELEVLLEHNVRFIPIPAGKFNVGREHGSLITNQLGFLNAGTKATDTSKIENRYAVMFSFSNEDCSTRHAGISMSLANEVYMTNFRDSLQEEWKTSVSHRSRVPVVFEGSSACVLLPQNYEGWEITADTQHCDLNPTAPTVVNDQAIEKPDLLTLDRLGDIRIMQETAPHYRGIGTFLLKDRYGHRLQAIEMDRKTAADKIREGRVYVLISGAAPEPQHQSIDVALPPLDCYKEKRVVKVEVPPSNNTVTVAPRDLGITLKVPPKALQQTGAPPTFAFTTCTPESFVYPDGYKSLSPIYYIAFNNPLKKELEVLLEHNVNIESSEQAEEMIFCIAQPPEDGSKEVRFIPIPAGKFNVGREHGSLITNQLGFLNAGTKATDTSKIENRYAVMFSFSNEDCSTRHAGISMSLANEVYMTNFRDSLEEEWKTSVSHRSRVPVVFEGSSACVLLPQNYEGWEITADTQHCDFPKETIDYDGRDCLAKMDYPPRLTFTIKATGNAKSCTLPFKVVGLTDEIYFKLQLNPTALNNQGQFCNAINF
ncbi:hypothetical protein GBAR_LOCUS2140 [Geodia barretti]|uniref:Uncharacterized protein n=1 Tax=Geodia barretti TaxID=519541 RepID=A0AA35QZG9_GEOBA|nr:hypothetical protein GBAR_LOCUS2140 [Geodia barretti]